MHAAARPNRLFDKLVGGEASSPATASLSRLFQGKNQRPWSPYTPPATIVI